MHETRFVNEIILRLKDALDKHEPGTPALINVRLSPFSHVTPEGLLGAFELRTEVAGLKNISLKIKPLALKIHCKNCGKAFESAKITFHCGACLSTNINIKKDKEFLVDSIVIEGRERKPGEDHRK